ncbi:hypothetical protein E1A91_A02G099800v1 [Gossypium mustelinum]|uniref:YMGG-like Gly-zipper domain-containing protein n=3 Tax=Gossypium TaxID=3633 RepID=A0A5J5WL37_GOSBA|nr:hypothetical protein ES319_A02G096500v1 [Gossypium barbadense]TYH27924.1 hypothetical protein ES288_A02G106100v1 [Gossypium darwinii]TYJ46130.1 hypothetical protein E1A91_A02G099800v1 [Gossypium mustelinum]
MDFTICPSSSFIMHSEHKGRYSYTDCTSRKFCCSAASAVITELFFAIFIFIFAVVGATLGGLTGAFVGAKTKMGLMHGAAVGVMKGSFLSIKLFQISLLICSSNDSALATRYLLQPINVFESTTPFIQVPWNKEGLSVDSMDKIPKMRITEENVLSNTNPCSIGLEDLLPWETVHIGCHNVTICSIYRVFKSG